MTLSDRPISTYSRTLMCINQRQASHCEVEPPITYRRHVTDTDITIFSNSRHATDTDNDFLVRCRHGTDTDSQTFKNCRHVCRHRQTADNLVCLTLDRPVTKFPFIFGPTCKKVCTHNWTTPIKKDF